MLVGHGHVYRLGGVQLCALLDAGAEATRVVVGGVRRAELGRVAASAAAAATVEMPREATSVAAVLRLGDARLARYGHVATARA